MILKQFKCTIVELDRLKVRGKLSVKVPDDWQFKEFRNHDSAPFLYLYTAGSATTTNLKFLYIKDKALPSEMGNAEYRGSIQLDGLWHIAGPI